MSCRVLVAPSVQAPGRGLHDASCSCGGWSQAGMNRSRLVMLGTNHLYHRLFPKETN